MATTVMTETIKDPLDPSRWTTPQELCLLQALTRFKPIGLHKHFRMLCIFDSLLTSGTIPQPVSEHPHCATVAGIWHKLGSLYDLKALDEREDAIFADVPTDDNDDGDNDDEESSQVIEYWREFQLSGHDFDRLTWARRLADHDETWSDNGDAADLRLRESTVADSDDPRSSPVGSVRGTRSSGRRTAVDRRLAEVKQETSHVSGGSSKSSRRTSKAASPSVRDEEDTEMQDVSQVDEDESDNEEEDSGQDETEDDSRKGRSTRGRGVSKRVRGRRRKRGK